jgi:predicted site-specific integrase-resolvase
MHDFVSIITTFCARLYGQRRTKRKTEQLIKELESKE